MSSSHTSNGGCRSDFWRAQAQSMELCGKPRRLQAHVPPLQSLGISGFAWQSTEGAKLVNRSYW